MTRSERVSADRPPPRQAPEAPRPQQAAPLQPVRSAAELAAEAAAGRQFERAMQRCRERLAGMSAADRSALRDSPMSRQPAKDEPSSRRREPAESAAGAAAEFALAENAARQDHGAAPAALAMQGAAPAYAAEAGAFADIFIRQVLTQKRDPRSLRLAFADAGWPLTRIDLAAGDGGGLTITLGARMGDVEALQGRIGDLREKLAERGLCAGGFEIVVTAAEEDGEDAA